MVALALLSVMVAGTVLLVAAFLAVKIAAVAFAAVVVVFTERGTAITTQTVAAR